MPARVPTLGAPGRTRRVWFVCDVLGIACAAGTWVLVLGAAGVLLRARPLPAGDAADGLAHGALFHLLAFLAPAAHARAMLTDPGPVPLGAVPLGAAPGGPRCPRCGCAQPPRAHHCMVGRRCIRKMDHHCPWVNNGVGEGNRKYFLLFTLYTALGSLHLLLLLGVPALRGYARGDWDSRSTLTPRASLVFLLLVALKGFLLGSAMFAAQMRAVCTDRTRIEQLQGERAGPGGVSKWVNLKAVLGHRLSLAWISPFASPRPQRARGPSAWPDTLPSRLGRHLLNPQRVLKGVSTRSHLVSCPRTRPPRQRRKKPQAVF
ncbi:palmitoyltransferase ZDHHC3-like [Neomonachus schauinslandi]|uniref:Palmitoyltransferase n=1 Tax=Neomonachus schauinslandi TaxID=29088 RepID=A0A2Y9GW62_NEOSC|nr:palmitoyltransferase ZDHHC3-like [Neomonachus schauinslandi]